MKPRAQYTLVKTKPFIRAHVDAYGVSEQDASNRLKSLLVSILEDLPKDCTVWDPEYKGLAPEGGQHYWTVVITLGEDKAGAESVIAQRVGSCT